MPEGPEVRRYADRLGEILVGQPIVSLTARTRTAREWLQAHPQTLSGRTVQRVTSHGKNLIGWIEGGFYFYSHLMMWGRWETVIGELPTERDRKERARIEVPTGGAILLSAPIFTLGHGDPYEQIELLGQLGTDILPYSGSDQFQSTAFQQRLLAATNATRTIGAALLDQQIVAGIGNYLRAEILFACRLDPWRSIALLNSEQLACLSCIIPTLARQAYETGGVTVPAALQAKMAQDASLVYRLGSEYGTRHYVFRRTNLPCLVCGNPIRQQRQPIRTDNSPDNTEEKTRIIYFCPVCQDVHLPSKPTGRRSRTSPTSIAE